VTVEIPREYRDAIVQHASEDDPNECCGLLATKDGKVMKHYRMINTERSPYRYSMDGKEFLARYKEIEDAGWEIGVIYHSHTHSPAYPSNTDIRLATWPDAYYMLVSLMDKQNPDVRLYTIVDGKVDEVPVEITG
jgi:proteasome lid subunit RPN8/RPN11